MNTNPIIYLLQELSWSNKQNKKIFIKNVLRRTKSMRDKLSKEDVVKKGLNIYNKRTCSIHLLLEEAINNSWIKEIEDEERNSTCLELTDKGLSTLINLYTDNHSESYQIYKEAVHELTEKYKEPPLNSVQIASFYWAGDSIGNLEKIYMINSGLSDKANSYHEYLMKLSQKEHVDNDFIMHIQPQLFVSHEDKYEPISLKINGVNLNTEIKIGQPYPNKRYFVAGFKQGKEKVFSGYYPIIATKEDFPKELKLNYHWFIGDEKEIIHEINIRFDFAYGNFFSTHQILSRNNEYKEFNLVTPVTDCIQMFNKNRDFTVDVSPDGKTQIIREQVVLKSFPKYLHSFDYANEAYYKFCESLKEN